jgi:DNA mismatch repair ATPase MutS
MFQEGNRSYFKCNESRELDEGIGDLDAVRELLVAPCFLTQQQAIKDTEAVIVTEMEEAILDCTNELQATFQALAELDCVLSFANIASDLQYVRPEILPGSEDCIEIVNGRHPLQELLIHGDFVANSTFLDRTDRVAVVTGPNFSGKSCYARQVGILVFMAQIGCFIPCEVARIAVVDQILARFSCVETCSIPQSTFQLELTQMGSILRKATSRSLIVSRGLIRSE